MQPTTATSKFPSAPLVYLIIAVPLWLIMVWGAFSWQIGTNWSSGDFWEHSAALNTWMQNLANPVNSHLASDAPSSRYMPFYLLVAAIGALLKLDPFQAMGVAGALSASVFVIAVPLFFNHYFRSPWAASIALPVLLLGWGSSWLWSNVYQLRTLFYTISFPSFFVIALSLLTFGLQVRILREQPSSGRGNRLWRLPLLAVLMAVLLLSHPLTGVFAGTTLGLLALTEPNVAWRTRIGSLGFLAAGTASTLLWPWYSITDVVFSQSVSFTAGTDIGAQILTRANSVFDRHPFYIPGQVLFTFGPLLIGIPVLIWMAIRRVHLWAPLGAVVMLIPYLVNTMIAIPLGHRFLLYLVFYCQVAVIWLLLRIFNPPAGQRTNNRLRWLTALLFSMVVIWNLGLAVVELRGGNLNAAGYYAAAHHPSPWRQQGNSALIQQYRALASHLDSDAVVMAEKQTGWPLPSFEGKVVTLFHPNPLIIDLASRSSHVRQFFAETTADQQRLHILSRYGVTHILFDRSKINENTLRFLDQLDGQRFQSGSLVMIELQHVPHHP